MLSRLEKSGILRSEFRTCHTWKKSCHYVQIEITNLLLCFYIQTQTPLVEISKVGLKTEIKDLLLCFYNQTQPPLVKVSKIGTFRKLNHATRPNGVLNLWTHDLSHLER